MAMFDSLIYVPSGEIVAVNVSEADYLDMYAEQHCEWVDGTVIRMSPVSGTHDKLSRYVETLLSAYLSFRPIAEVRQDPFVMRLPKARVWRQPDLMIVLKTNPHALTENSMNGPADLCVEIVSPGSDVRDYGEKLAEYEKGGVGEYWIIDPNREDARFYKLVESVYKRQDADANGNYRTPTLPGLVLHVPTLWLSELPNTVAIVEAVRAMLGES